MRYLKNVSRRFKNGFRYVSFLSVISCRSIGRLQRKHVRRLQEEGRIGRIIFVQLLSLCISLPFHRTHVSAHPIKYRHHMLMQTQSQFHSAAVAPDEFFVVISSTNTANLRAFAIDHPCKSPFAAWTTHSAAVIQASPHDSPSQTRNRPQ